MDPVVSETPAPPAARAPRWGAEPVLQGMVLLALVNAFIATYLHLWKIGQVGTLSCATGVQCAVVQFSRWAWFAGVDVALWGAVGYTAIVLVAGTALAQPRWRPRLVPVLVGLTTAGVAMTLRLKYGEWVDLGLFCPWCLPSALSMPLLWLGAWRLWRARTHG